MRNYLYNETDNDLLSEVNNLLEFDVETAVIEAPKVKEQTDDGAILIPINYRIFTTHNGEPTGKKDFIDTFNCDRTRGIVPIGKARSKADLLKRAYKNKVFFVMETSNKVVGTNKVVLVEKIVHQTN